MRQQSAICMSSETYCMESWEPVRETLLSGSPPLSAHTHMHKQFTNKQLSNEDQHQKQNKTVNYNKKLESCGAV